jgi:polysaccharide export outer membrane protein
MNCKNLSHLGRFTVMVGLALLAGCTQALKSTTNAEGNQGVFKVASGHDSSLNEYVVDPPDEIVIKAPNIKEIDGSKQVVRPDGRITLNLLHDVKVSGLTPAQIQQQLTELASKFYNNPDIRVEVTAQSKFYQIFGRGVNQQGKRPYTGNDTVIKALAEAGLSAEAWPQQIWVVRPGREGHPPARAVVDFKHMSQTGDLSQNYVLQENDIITVPDSPLNSFNTKFTLIAGPITGAGSVGSSVTPGVVR